MHGNREMWRRGRNGKIEHSDTLQEHLIMCFGNARKTPEGGLECAQSRQRCKFESDSGPGNGYVKERIQRTNAQEVVSDESNGVGAIVV